MRPELNRKSTILGFYGVAPNADILVQDITKPLDRLAFILLADRGEGEFQISFQVTHTNGAQLVQTPAQQLRIEGQRRNSFALSFSRFQFPGPGRYVIKFLVDGQEHFQSSFEVRQGLPSDFG